MNPIRSIFFLIFALMACSPASAETMNFEDATAILGASCGQDIDANCRGVNLDATRLKECLTRNQDSISPQCKADYGRIFDAIQKRVAARGAVRKICERDAQKLCAGAQKDDGKIIQCLVTAPRGISARCVQAVGEAGYRK
jgi:hypothetical protein